MAEASWPFYGVETNETQFSKWARAMAYSGIVSGLALTPGTGMQIIVAIGEALVRGVFYENNTTKALAVGAAPGAGLTRRDAIVLRLDQTANTITAAVKVGGANTGGGALPALTQNETIWELQIGVVTVASGMAAITGASIAQDRPSVKQVGVGPVEVRPSASAGPMVWFDTAGNRMYVSDGAVWFTLINAESFQGILPLAKGGTGVQSAKALRAALDIMVQPTDPGHKKGRVWIPGTALD